jgi:hypothetical protein
MRLVQNLRRGRGFIEPNIPCVHFVGFRGEEYWSAWKVWGDPTYVHIGWDLRARREIAPEDIIVFANGAGDLPPRIKSYPDLIEANPQ